MMSLTNSTLFVQQNLMHYLINRANDENTLEIDFGAFDFSIPHLALNYSIGNGQNYVSKFMTSKLSGSSESAKPLVDYLLAMNHQGEVRK